MGTQTEILHAEPRSEIDTDEDATTTSGKYIVSNLMEMSDISGADSDDDFDFLYEMKLLLSRLELL